MAASSTLHGRLVRSFRLRSLARGLLWTAAAMALPYACDKAPPPPPATETAAQATPDRLPPQQRSSETATAFGLSLPKGMRLTRQFNDSAYFMGRLELSSVVEHLKPHLEAQRMEVKPGYTAFENARLKGDTSEKRLRVGVSAEGPGTQVFVQNVTPPPTPRGVSEAEMLRRAGRNPDGTPLDQNQLY
jgi:hypothetical protein